MKRFTLRACDQRVQCGFRLLVSLQAPNYLPVSVGDVFAVDGAIVRTAPPGPTFLIHLICLQLCMLPTGERYAHLHLERGHKDSGLYVIPKDGSVRPRLAYCRPRNHTVAERIRAFELRAWSPRATHAQVDASLVGIFHGRPIYEPPTIASLFSQLAVSANKYLSLSLSLSSL